MKWGKVVWETQLFVQGQWWSILGMHLRMLVVCLQVEYHARLELDAEEREFHDVVYVPVAALELEPYAEERDGATISNNRDLGNRETRNELE
jgi:hypothetical protein